MAKRFEGKVVVVTGASSGIGRAAALAFAREGAKVVLAARRKERIEAVAKEIEEGGSEALALSTDVTDSSQVTRMIEAAVERFGRLDVLVNNAGYGLEGLVESASVAEARRLFDVNVLSVISATQAALPHLRRTRGVVVNVASIAGISAFPLHAVYSASKHAVVGLGCSLAFEVADDGIRVVTVCPGPVDTEFVQAMEGDRLPDTEVERLRFAFDRPETIARGVLRAARRRRSGVVLPSIRSALPVWLMRVLGPVARLAMRAYARRLRPLLGQGNGAERAAATEAGAAS